MRLVSFAVPGGGTHLGLVQEDEVLDLTALNPAAFPTCAELIMRGAAGGRSLPALVQEGIDAGSGPERWLKYADLDRPPDPAAPYLVRPLEPAEVWAAGVTYLRSRDARERESHGATVYDRVYAAPRPELFFKATAARTGGPNGPVGIRRDSRWMVPEPELALVIGPGGAIVGYTAGNDMSSRDIEGENPLYLPQAKVFRHACAIGPTLLLAEGDHHPEFPIYLQIRRGGALVLDQAASTAQMKRSFGELVRYLVDCDLYAPTVLMTGTGIVPADDFTLEEGDVIEVTIPQVGTLRNHVIPV